jgi:hypothetical protein
VSQWKVLLEKTGVMDEMDVMERTVVEDAEGLVGLREEEGGPDLQGLGAQKAPVAQKVQKAPVAQKVQKAPVAQKAQKVLRAQKVHKAQKVLRAQKVPEVQRAIASQIPIIYGR